MSMRSVQLKILDPLIGKEFPLSTRAAAGSAGRIGNTGLRATMKFTRRVIALSLLLSILFVGAARADGSRTLQGLVVGVLDGDTIDLLVDGRQGVRVRLAGIDAPEKAQAFGQVSKKSLSDLVYNKSAVVQVMDTDQYGRTVGRVAVNGLDVNLEQVKRGLAWAFDRFVKDPKILVAHAQARTERRGLWSHPNPTAPWDFRREDSAR